MKLLRPLASYTFYDHKTNDYIGCELRITGILDKTDEYRRKWLSHLQRMPQNRIALKSYHYRPQGRTIGRPKKRWREQLYLWRRNGSKGSFLMLMMIMLKLERNRYFAFLVAAAASSVEQRFTHMHRVSSQSGLLYGSRITLTVAR